MTHVLLPLDRPEAWPASLGSLLCGLYELFLIWQNTPWKMNPQDYDRAINGHMTLFCGSVLTTVNIRESQERRRRLGPAVGTAPARPYYADGGR